MRNKPSIFIRLSTLVGAAALFLSMPCFAGAPLVHPGETVAFLGDSITAGGAASPSGYVRLVESGLDAVGIPIKVIPAGVSGHKSNQMLERLERDVLSKKPDWMTLSCGVNDVWHGDRGVPLDEYERNITEILDLCLKAEVKVIVLTSTQIQLPVDNPNNVKLAAYNDFLRKIAKARKLPLADLNAAMLEEQKALASAGKNRSLTTDGVHMNVFGNLMMARGVLRAIGLDEKQLVSAQTKWQSLSEAVHVSVPVKMSITEYETLEGSASAQKKTVDGMLGEQVKASLKGLLSRP